MTKSCGISSPITPVEEENTLDWGIFKTSDTAEVIASTETFPRKPVNALALPEFTTIAAPNELSFRWIFSSQSITAKDLVEEDVKTPAISVPGSKITNITSLRPWYLIPAEAVEKFTPFIAGISGKLTGASGETFSILDIYFSRNKILDFWVLILS
jgi:hypothetical protein